MLFCDQVGGERTMSSSVNLNPVIADVQAFGTVWRIGGTIADKVSQHWNQGKHLAECKCQLEECQEQLKQLEEQQKEYQEKLRVSEEQREENEGRLKVSEEQRVEYEQKLRVSEEQRQLLIFLLVVLAGIIVVGVVNYKLVPRSFPAA